MNNDGSSSNIEVLEGKVAVTGSDKQRLIKAGFGTLVEAGEEPIPARKLLPKPDLETLPARIRQINWRLSWASIKEATSYRIEIAKEENFDTLIGQQITDYNRSAIPDIPDGTYHVRVRGIDQLGLEGLKAPSN